MVNATLSLEQIRVELAQALLPYKISVDEFLKSEIDEYSDSNLQDIWLMAKGIFPVSE